MERRSKKRTRRDEIVLRWPESVPRDQISEEFLQGMLNRMAVGFHNYGHIKEMFPERHDALANLRLRVKTYKRTRNTEFLMDAANYCMIEFCRPSIAGAFFAPTSKKDSPGSIRKKDRKVLRGKEEEPEVVTVRRRAAKKPERCPRCGRFEAECSCSE